MAGSSTSLRRPRSSMGPADAPLFDTLHQPAVDIEFRRKHSRQNKEIIGENVQHKNSIRVLREEITHLKEELLETKHANAILTGQLEAFGGDRRSAHLNAGLQAIDILIEALPALSLLRNDLAASTSKPTPIPYEVARANLLRNMGMTIATRPAASGSRNRGLDTLGEENEEICASQSDLVEEGGRDRIGSIVSPLGKATSRSPALNRIRKSGLPTFVVNSPSLSSPSASPSPRRRIVRSPNRKARRRRESGLLIPPPHDQPARHAEPVTRDLLSPDQGLSSPVEKYETPLTIDELPIDLITITENQDADRPMLVSESDSRLGDSTSTGSSELYETLSSGPSTTSVTEESARPGRRARVSVNYKEPSLTKKMRKPDGIAIPDLLTHQRLLAHDSTTPEMALPRPGMRRKSVLPKSSNKLPDPVSYALSDDDDAVDADEIENSLLGTSSRYTSTTPRLDSTNDTSSLLSDPPSPPLASSTGSTLSELELDEVEVERVPTPIPPVKATPAPTPTILPVLIPVISAPRSSPTLTTTDSKPKTTTTRISPRKAPSSQSSTKPAPLTRPEPRRPSTLKARPSRVTTPSARMRDALAAVSEPNVPAKTASGRTSSSTGISKRV